MKYLSSFFLILILLCTVAASAETPELILTEFEDFSVRTGHALEYIGEKADGQPLFMYYSSSDGNITMTAVNAVWSQNGSGWTPEEFSEMCRNTESAVRAQYEASGLYLKEYNVREAVREELWGLPALRCDTDLLVQINDTEVNLSQRVIRIAGSFGTYTFSISAWSPELLDSATDSLIMAVQWK